MELQSTRRLARDFTFILRDTCGHAHLGFDLLV